MYLFYKFIRIGIFSLTCEWHVCTSMMFGRNWWLTYCLCNSSSALIVLYRLASVSVCLLQLLLLTLPPWFGRTLGEITQTWSVPSIEVHMHIVGIFGSDNYHRVKALCLYKLFCRLVLFAIPWPEFNLSNGQHWPWECIIDIFGRRLAFLI